MLTLKYYPFNILVSSTYQGCHIFHNRPLKMPPLKIVLLVGIYSGNFKNNKLNKYIANTALIKSFFQQVCMADHSTENISALHCTLS